MPGTISTQQALIYTMVTMSGVEGKIKHAELAEIGQLVMHLPVFKHFDQARLTTVAQEAGEILQEPEGLKAVLGLVKSALSPKLRETAYALAVEVDLPPGGTIAALQAALASAAETSHVEVSVQPVDDEAL